MRPMPTFKELFCSQRGCAPKAYARAALGACLRIPARGLRLPLRVVAPDFFTADLDLINNVGRLTSPFELDLDITEYRYHPFNQNRLRRTLGLSLSTSRLRRLVFNTFLRDNPSTVTRAPFEAGQESGQSRV